MKICSIAIVALLATVLTGCSTDNASDPWHSTVLAAAENATSDFEREVLSDGKITAEENREAAERWKQCMADKGFVAGYSFLESGSMQTEFVAQEEDLDAADAANAECEKDTLATIGMLYRAIQDNPENLEPGKVYADCLIRHGLVDESFTSEDYLTAIIESEAPDMSDVPWDVTDPASDGCMTSPAK